MIAVAIAEFRKDILVFLSDRSHPIFLILIPLLIVFFASYAIQGLVTSSARYNLPVIDLDQTAQSDVLITALRNEGQLDLTVETGDGAFDATRAAAILGGGRRIAVLVIPKGAGQAIIAGTQVEFPLYVDPTQETRYGLTLLAIERALYRYSAPRAAVSIVARAVGVPEASIEQDVTGAIRDLLANPAVSVEERATTRGGSLPNAYDQTVPGIALMWTIGAFAYAVNTATEERVVHHTWTRVLGTPASRLGVVMGRWAALYCIVIASVASLFLVGAVAFGLDTGSAPVLTATLLAFCSVPAAAGVFLAVSGVDRQIASIASGIGMFAIGAVSGAFVPLYVLPVWMERLAIVSPLYWGKEAVQDVIIRHATLGDVLVPVAALLSLASAVMFASVYRFRTLRA